LNPESPKPPTLTHQSQRPAKHGASKHRLPVPATGNRRIPFSMASARFSVTIALHIHQLHVASDSLSKVEVWQQATCSLLRTSSVKRDINPTKEMDKVRLRLCRSVHVWKARHRRGHSYLSRRLFTSRNTCSIHADREQQRERIRTSSVPQSRAKTLYHLLK